MDHYIGIDIGGSSIRAGLVSDSGEILQLGKQKTVQTAEGIQSILKQLVAALILYADKNNITIKGIGIGSPGPLDKEKGMILNTPNLPNNIELKEPLQKAFPIPVVVENDANCFGLAEVHFGKAKDKRYVLGITLGTGFGSCLVIDKKLYLGRGNATEFGHTTIKYDGEKTQTTFPGSVEFYVSKASQKMYGMKQGLQDMSPRILHELSEEGNTQAIKAFEEYGSYLGIALANFINTLDPEIVVIGGACAKSFPFFKKTMLREIKRRLIVKPTEIVPSSLEHAGVLGAAALFF